MRSASMLLASSGMLPDDLRTPRALVRTANELADLRKLESGQRPRFPNRAALLTRSRHRDHEFAVLLGHEVFGAAG